MRIPARPSAWTPTRGSAPTVTASSAEALVPAPATTLAVPSGPVPPFVQFLTPQQAVPGMDQIWADIWPMPWRGPLDTDNFSGETSIQRKMYRALYLKEPALQAALEGKIEAVASLDVTVNAGNDVTYKVIAENTLKESEDRFRAFLEHSPIAEWLVDPNGNVVLLANRLFDELLSYNSQEPVGKTISEMFPPSIISKIEELMRRVSESKSLVADSVTLVIPDRPPTELWVVMFPVPLASGGIQIGGVAVDLTTVRRAEERLRVLGTAIEASPNAVFISSRDGTIQWANPAFTQMSGYTLDELIGQTPRLLKSGRQDSAYYRDLWNVILSGRVWTGEVVERHKNGSEYFVRQTITPLTGPDGTITDFVAVQEDMTQRKQAEDRLRHQAVTDPLTGLMNRAGFRDRLMAGLSGEPAAIHFIDLDRFKLVNDAFGHSFGDDLLGQVADRIRDRLRATDVFSRLGGDEFAILQPRIRGEEDASGLAAALIAAINHPFMIGGQEVRIGASIGVTLFPNDGRDSDTLIRNADLAMYQAKQSGRGTFRFFTHSLNVQVQSRVAMEIEIRRGLDAGEFVIHYQPQVRLEDGKVFGAEALVRWQHPTRGLLPPSEFLPVAEDSGQILAIGEWVLRTACKHARAWSDKGHQISVAVNVSNLQIERDVLESAVDDALRDSGLPPQRLELEVTEGVFLPSVQSGEEILRRIHDRGIRVSVDDFGTGYSSLSYLRRLPVDRLKIDRSFVIGLPIDNRDAALVRAIVGLGHDLGLRVIAEGVETDNQLEFLQSIGCDEVQGYHFARPLPADEFTRYLDAH